MSKGQQAISQVIRSPSGLPDAAVPCGSCTACCLSGDIILWPDMGDDPALFKTRRTFKPDLGHVIALRRRTDGACIHLGPANGCSVYAHRPAVCRKFDCRTMYLDIMRRPRRYRRSQTKPAKAVMAEGRKRLHTLESSDG